jgi:hypothetical protein
MPVKQRIFPLRRLSKEERTQQSESLQGRDVDLSLNDVGGTNP